MEDESAREKAPTLQVGGLSCRYRADTGSGREF